MLVTLEIKGSVLFPALATYSFCSASNAGCRRQWDRGGKDGLRGGAGWCGQGDGVAGTGARPQSCRRRADLGRPALVNADLAPNQGSRREDKAVTTTAAIKTFSWLKSAGSTL